MTQSQRKTHRWTSEDLETLITLLKRHKETWRDHIHEFFPNQTRNAIMRFYFKQSKKARNDKNDPNSDLFIEYYYHHGASNKILHYPWEVEDISSVEEGRHSEQDYASSLEE